MTYTEFLVLVAREVRGRDWNDHLSDDRKRDIAYSSVLAVGANADISRLSSEESSLSSDPVDGYSELRKANLPSDLFHYRQDNGIIHFEFDRGVIKYPHLHNRSFHSLRMIDGNEFYTDEPFMNIDSQGRVLYFINSDDPSIQYIPLFEEPDEYTQGSLQVPLVAGDIQQAVHVMAVYLKSIDIRDAGEASVQSMVAQMISVQTQSQDA